MENFVASLVDEHWRLNRVAIGRQFPAFYRMKRLQRTAGGLTQSAGFDGLVRGYVTQDNPAFKGEHGHGFHWRENPDRKYHWILDLPGKMHRDVDLIEREFKTKARRYIRHIDALYKARKEREEKQHRPQPPIQLHQVFGDPQKMKERRILDNTAARVTAEYIKRAYADGSTAFDHRFFDNTFWAPIITRDGKLRDVLYSSWTSTGLKMNEKRHPLFETWLATGRPH